MFTTFVATLRVQSRNCCNCFGHSRRWAVLPSDHLFSTFLVWWSGGPFQELNSFLNVYCSGHPPLEAEACARTMSSMIGFNCTDDACAQALQGFCHLGPLVFFPKQRSAWGSNNLLKGSELNVEFRFGIHGFCFC